MVDMHVEPAPPVFVQRVWELGVCVAENPVLWVFIRFAVFVSLAGRC